MVLSNAGTAIMGIGEASGEGRAVNASRGAITSPLLESSIEGARGILVNIAGGPDLGLFEVNEAMEIIHGVAHPDANIIFGNVIDEAMADDVRVTVIAAGFERWEEARSGEPRPEERSQVLGSEPVRDEPVHEDIFATPADDELDLGDDEFDVPSFLR
jgi:cell division protein FtsZ